MTSGPGESISRRHLHAWVIATATAAILSLPLACEPAWDGWEPGFGSIGGTETGGWGGDGDGDGDGDWEGGDEDGWGKLDMPDEGDASGSCSTLDLPWDQDTIVVGPEQAAQLSSIVATAAPYTTILLHDGTYDLSASEPIRLSKSGVGLRAASGERGAVILDGGHVLDELVIVEASRTSVAHLTLARAKAHAIRVTGAADSDTIQTQIYDVVIRDPGKQAILITRSNTGTFADQGEIGCSRLQLGDLGRAALDGCEIAGIDARGARGWDVHDNQLVGWWCADALAQPAIHFWQASRDTIVQRNTIQDSAQGIGFGSGELPSGDERTYADISCPGVIGPGHLDGTIRNNEIWTARAVLFASTHGVVSGISLERACSVVVAHNTVVSLGQPQSSITYRWPDTDANIINNLVTHSIVPFADAQAELTGNLVDASLDNFLNPEHGNVHLAAGSVAIDAAAMGGGANDDIDGQLRTGVRDVGADESID